MAMKTLLGSYVRKMDQNYMQKEGRSPSGRHGRQGNPTAHLQPLPNQHNELNRDDYSQPHTLTLRPGTT